MECLRSLLALFLAFVFLKFVFGVVFGAFSKATRLEIFKRDRGTCQDCGRKWDDGWMLHCSHYDHDKSKPDYDSPSAGRLQCVDDHIKYHTQLFNKAKTPKERNENAWAIRQLRKTNKRRYGF